MALPKVEVPTFEIILPSTGKPLKFRPWLSKEEKILFMAVAGGDEAEVVRAVKDIIRACILTPVDIDKFASFDLEYFFLKLRAKSTGDVITLRFTGREDSPCDECKKEQVVDVDLNTVEVKKTEGHTTNIKLNSKIGVVMRYPIIGDTGKNDVDTTSVEQLFESLAKCIEQVYEVSGEVTDATDTTLAERVEWIDNLPKKELENLMKFFETMPTLKHTINIVCPKCGAKDAFDIEGLQSFFV